MEKNSNLGNKMKDAWRPAKQVVPKNAFNNVTINLFQTQIPTIVGSIVIIKQIKQFLLNVWIDFLPLKL